MLKRVANIRDPKSWASKMRRQRLRLFEDLLSGLPRPVRVIDIGGSRLFWEATGFDRRGIHITLVNLDEGTFEEEGFSAVVGDARHLDFSANAFDVAFSNSVIEHVGGAIDRQMMAADVLRVAPRYFVQTPNRGFPLEPHFLFPMFQFLPFSLQWRLAFHLHLGWEEMPTPKRAMEAVKSIHLLTKADLVALFPGARIYEEKVLGLTKSFVAYGGW